MRTVRRWFVPLLLCATTASAQPVMLTSASDTVRASSVVRVWVATGIPRQEFFVTRWSADSLWGTDRDALLAFDRSTITRLDVGHSRPRGKGIGRGMAIGLAAGVGAAALAGLGDLALGSDSEFKYMGAILILVIGTPVAAVGGGIIGAIAPGRSWRTVCLQ